MSDFDEALNDECYTGTVQEMASDSRIILYVEGEIDRIHWGKMLECANVLNKFEISLFGRTTGKPALVNLFTAGGVNKSTMIAIDADLDYILETPIATILDHPYVHHTYVYGIEGIILHENVVKKFLDRIYANYSGSQLDYDIFLQEYSMLCYQVLVGIVSKNISTDFNVEFELCKLTGSLCSGNQTYDIPDLNLQCQELPNYDETIEKLTAKGVNPSNAYRYINGHVLYGVIAKVISHIKREIIRIHKAILEEAKDKREITSIQCAEKKKEMENIVNNLCCLETYLPHAMLAENDNIAEKIYEKLISC